MKLKCLTPDPATLLAAGLNTLSDAAVLVHAGRCGLSGCTVNELSDALRMPYGTITQCLERLRDLGMVTRFSRTNRRGRAYWYVVTVKSWEVLTTQPDVHLFSWASKPLKGVNP
jgi:DNA-binding MarR family transcriptional regulator